MAVNGVNTENPSTSQQNINNYTFEDANSTASSARTLQMSLLENKLELEMANMSRTIKDTVTGLTEYMNSKLSEVDSKFNNLLADLAPTRIPIMIMYFSVCLPANLLQEKTYETWLGTK